MFIDSWNSEYAYLHADNILIWTKSFTYNSRKIQNICGWMYDDIPHN